MRRVKYGAALGAGFAITAYLIADMNGFNRTSFLYMIYLYVILGAVSRLDKEDLTGTISVFERLLIVADREEKKLKKIATGETYKIDGTIKKIGD